MHDNIMQMFELYELLKITWNELCFVNGYMC